MTLWSTVSVMAPRTGVKPGVPSSASTSNHDHPEQAPHCAAERGRQTGREQQCQPRAPRWEQDARDFGQTRTSSDCGWCTSQIPANPPMAAKTIGAVMSRRSSTRDSTAKPNSASANNVTARTDTVHLGSCAPVGRHTARMTRRRGGATADKDRGSSGGGEAQSRERGDGDRRGSSGSKRAKA